MKIYTVQKGSAGIDGFSAASASGLKWARSKCSCACERHP